MGERILSWVRDPFLVRLHSAKQAIIFLQMLPRAGGSLTSQSASLMSCFLSVLQVPWEKVPECMAMHAGQDLKVIDASENILRCLTLSYVCIPFWVSAELLRHKLQTPGQAQVLTHTPRKNIRTHCPECPQLPVEAEVEVRSPGPVWLYLK